MARDPLRLEVPSLIQALEAGRQDGQPVLMDAQEAMPALSISDRGFEQLLSQSGPRACTSRPAQGRRFYHWRIDRGRPVAL